MKKYIVTCIACLISITTFAQVDTRKRIEVTGTAESEVTPDIIYFGISLKEYFKDNNSKKKIDIEDLEKQLQTAVINAGIAKEDFTINNISSYNYTMEKKKNPDFLASKQYRLKVTDLSKLNQIMNGVDAKGILSTNIESYDYSKIEPLKKSLKVKALQSAREKATYMAEAVGEKLGGALEIQEINNESFPQPIYRANYAMRAQSADASFESSMPEIDFKKIKLNYQMRTVFELK